MEPPTPEQEEKRDEEGLLLKYDVILYGTGLVQSILASAIARAGKSVLHCDGADHYGELDAVWNLSMIEEQKQQELSSNEPMDIKDDADIIPLLSKGGTSSLTFHSQSEVSYFGIHEGSKVETPFGTGTVKTIPNNSTESLTVALDWTLADGKASLAYFRLDDGEISDSAIELEQQFFEKHGIQTRRTSRAKAALKNERFLALDATPAFVLAAGKAVSGMLASNVAEYLEFKSLQGLYWLDDTGLSRVPCSKNDVFGTKLLAPMDKRRLMKFIQLSMDYATQLSAAEELMLAQNKEKENSAIDSSNVASPESEVQSLNERHLNMGRSLARPQNKAVSTKAMEELQQCMQQQMTFDDFLADKHKLSSKLRAIVRYALAWEQDSTTTTTSLSQGMANLRQHLQALGRFGNTAFIVPMYGSGELSQAFCRSAAVFGATYLLRRAIGGIVVEKDNNVDGVVVLPDMDFGDVTNAKEKKIECSTVVAPVSSIPATFFATPEKKKRILRRISILSGKVIPSEDGDRHVVFIPPNSRIGNSHAIHCVTVDDTIYVAPKGCSIMHLTTTIDFEEQKELDDSISILTRASELILEKNLSKEETVDELYHVCFSHDDVSVDMNPKRALPKGLYLCHHSGQALNADAAFEQAQKLFNQICPGMKFLGLSDDLDAVIKERAAERGYDDDERLMLESALDMIGDEERASADEEKDIGKGLGENDNGDEIAP